MARRLDVKVRQLRERARQGQTAFAQRLGMQSRGYISEVEYGKTLPPAEEIMHVANLVNLTTDFLVRMTCTTLR